MLGSKNRDYKTEHKRTKIRLQKHQSRMDELIKQGMKKREASKIAFDEIMQGKL